MSHSGNELARLNAIQAYVQEYGKAGETSTQLEDVDEDGFGTVALDKWFMGDPLRYEALVWWHMDPKNLVKIIDEVEGAEIYTFNHLDVMDDLVKLFKTVQDRSKEPYDDSIEISTQWVREYVRDHVLTWYHSNMLNGLVDQAAEGHDAIEYDRALGIIIKTRMAIEAIHCIISPPGGDNTYFDYYPGTWRYHMAVMNWFLHDGPRMP